jgi:hypothetical protein
MQASWSLQSAALQQVSAGMQAAPHRFVPALHRFFLFLRFRFFLAAAPLPPAATVTPPRSRVKIVRRRAVELVSARVQQSKRDVSMTESFLKAHGSAPRPHEANVGLVRHTDHIRLDSHGIAALGDKGEPPRRHSAIVGSDWKILDVLDRGKIRIEQFEATADGMFARVAGRK